MTKRKRTTTSPYGVSGRVSHDSTPFYSRGLYAGMKKEEQAEYVENPVPKDILNRVFCKSSEKMSELPDSSVHLVVTSPPYNVGKEYDADLTFEEYRELLRKVWTEVKRILVPGGRVCINVANLGRRPYIPLNAFVTYDMLQLGFLMRGEIIWNKSSSSGTSTAWGSWLSATNPVLRDTHEYILIFSKGTFYRENCGRKSTISKEEFLEFTKSVWEFPAESARKIGHPAPFPVSLPLRLIKLYTFEEEVVLDPFMGSGTTAVASMLAGRYYVGYEIDENYVKLSEERVRKLMTL